MILIVFKSMFLSDHIKMYFGKNIGDDLSSKMFFLHKQVCVALSVDTVDSGGY